MPPRWGRFFIWGLTLKNYLFIFFPLLLISFSSNALQCGVGKVEVDGVCVSSCKVLEGTGRNLTWDSYIWGDNPRSYCVGNPSTGAACDMAASSVSISVEEGKWTNRFVYTGSTCSFEKINRFSGDSPEPFPFENDVNHNGVDDDEEDWDGDGIKNGDDPTPYQSDNPIVDENGNGIDDLIESSYDEINAIPDVIYCNNENNDCSSLSSTMSELARSNNVLVNAMKSITNSGLRRNDFINSMSNVTEQIKNGNDNVKERINELSDSFYLNQSYMSADIHEVKTFLNSRISGVGYDIVMGVKDNKELLESYDVHIEATSRNVLNNHDILGNILSKLESGSSGLTKTQKSQLRKAALANDNNILLQDVDERTKTMQRMTGQLFGDIASLQGNFGSIDGKFAQLDGKFAQVNGNFDMLGGQFSQLNYKLDNLEVGEVDLSGLETGIAELGEKIDALELDGDNSVLEGKIDNLIGAVTNDKPFSVSSSGFTGEGFLFNQNELSELQEDVIEIKQEVIEEMDKFKTLFSIDTSSFNDGNFKEHSLNLRVNGSEQSFKSGVFTALLDNAAIISAVIMFLFVLSGIRMLGKD
ncbi:hypothetical protein BCS62_13630 [Vibrio cyclitrophicus]